MKTIMRVYDEDDNIIFDSYFKNGSLRYSGDKDWWFFEVYTKGYKKIKETFYFKGMGGIYFIVEYKKKIKTKHK